MHNLVFFQKLIVSNENHHNKTQAAPYPTLYVAAAEAFDQSLVPKLELDATYVCKRPAQKNAA